jgi:hypothetical protein
MDIISYKKKENYLEETVNLAGDGVDVDIEVARSSGETRNGLDIGSKRVPFTMLV